MRFNIDTHEVQSYIKYLQSLNYKQVQREADILVRNMASDVLRSYRPFIPVAKHDGSKNKYGLKGGNLRRSLKTFRKKPKAGSMVSAYSVGFKQHKYGELAAKMSSGKNVSDGYYGAWVTLGVAGRSGSSTKSKGFRERAKPVINSRINSGLSDKASRNIARKLDKLKTRGRI